MNEVVRRRQMKALYRRFYTWLIYTDTHTHTTTPINNNKNIDFSSSSSDVYNQSHPSLNPTFSSPATASKVDTAGATSLLPAPLPPSYDNSISVSNAATVGIDKEKVELIELLKSYLERKNTSTSVSASSSDSNNSNTSTNPINSNSINNSASSPSTPLRIMTSQDAYTIIQYELRILSEQCESLEERNKVLLGQLGDRQMANKVLEQVYAYLTRETSRI